MSDTTRNNRTNDEIEALLREQAGQEAREGTGRVARRVVSQLRTDVDLRARRDAPRLSAIFDDEGGVPRWFLAAAVVAISALAGWLVFGPSAGTTGGPGGAGGPGGIDIAADSPAALPDPGMFEVSPRQLLAQMVKPQNEMFRREARALVGAGWELAGRVLSGIPVELVKPADDHSAG